MHAETTLDDLWPCGLFLRGGDVVGAWARLPSARGAVDLACRRSPGDVLAARVEEAGVEAPHPGPANMEAWLDGGGPVPGRPRSRFGAAVGRLDGMARRDPRVAAGAMAASPASRVLCGGDGLDARALDRAVRAAAVASTFLDTLDQRALDFARAADLFLELGAEWSGIDSTMVPGAPLRSVLARYPCMRSLLVRAWASDPRGFRAACAGDAGRALSVAVAADPAFPAWVARDATAMHDAYAAAEAASACSSSRMATGGLQHDGRLRHLAFVVDGLPPSWRPRGGGWAAYMVAAPTVMAAVDGFLSAAPGQGRPGRGDVVRLLNSKGDWAGWTRSLAASAGVPQADLGHALRCVLDVPHRYAAQVLLPAMALAGGSTRVSDVVAVNGLARAAFLSGRSIRRLLQDSRRWHGHVGEIEAVAAGLPGADAANPPWPAALPDHWDGDLWLRVLVTGVQLVAEGGTGLDRDGEAGLSHCVGGHGVHCRSGRARVASVRRRSPGGPWRRVSTVEFLLDGTVGGIDVGQHRGMRNGPVPDDVRDFVDAYAHRVALDGLVRPSELAPVPVPGGLLGAGYDFRIPGNWDEVARRWDPFVPHVLRGLGAGGVAAAFGRFRSRHDGRQWYPESPLS